MEPVAIVCAIALLQFVYFSILVGKARGTHGVEAPATTGHPVFERHFRVQQNTLEQLVVFVPALWMFAYYVNVTAAAALGGVFILGRFLYAASYVSDPGRRGAGFAIGMLASLALVIGSLVGPALTLFQAAG
jgi:uncharacterized MAPEG superfamily protein